MKFDKFTDVCMTGGIRHTPSHTNVCKFFFSTYIFSADITPDKLKLCRVTKVKVHFLGLVYVFNFNLFEFSAAILEKGSILLSLRFYTVCMETGTVCPSLYKYP